MSIFKPSGPVVQNFDYRMLTTNGGLLVDGGLFLTSIELPLGFTISTVYWWAGTTTLVNGGAPHYWVAIFDSSTRALLRQSTDNTAKAIVASTLISDSLSSSFTTTYGGQHLVGIMVASNAGTQPTFGGFSGLSANLNTTGVGGQKYNGNSTTALTTTAPNPAGAITGSGSLLWCGVA